MKRSNLILTAVLLLTPFFLAAQSYLGDWQWSQKTPDGNTLISTMSFKADGTYAVDFESDGTPEVMGVYTYDNGNMTIRDTSEGACKDVEAVYALKIEGNKATATMVSDPCEVRAGDGEAMILTRK